VVQVELAGVTEQVSDLLVTASRGVKLQDAGPKQY
jgi:hypothetical protein